MDIGETLRQLREERARLVAAIAQLGSLDDHAKPPRSRRGRTSMGEAERREVSERMKKYRARRRKAQDSV